MSESKDRTVDADLKEEGGAVITEHFTASIQNIRRKTQLKINVSGIKSARF